MSQRLFFSLALVLACLAVAAGIYVNSPAVKLQKVKQQKAEISALTLHYQTPRLLNDFALVDHQAQAFTKQDVKDHWSFVFLGYTSCPDICPTTLQELNFVYSELSQISSGKTQILLVSADPLRDSSERLNQYINYFNQEFIALRGEHDALFPFARNLGLMYSIVDDPSQADYLVNHSASIILLNPQGNIEAIFKPEHQAGQVTSINSEQLVTDFAAIVKAYTG
jgi:protein SCO1/2